MKKSVRGKHDGVGTARKLVLIADDDPNFLVGLAEMLQGRGYQTMSALSTVDALGKLRYAGPFDLLIASTRLDRIATAAREGYPSVPRIILVASDAGSLAARSIGAGAAAALAREPLDAALFFKSVADVLRDREPEKQAAPRTVLIGTSPQMAEVMDMVRRIASDCAPVLITGESGTGKELVARSLHELAGLPGQFVAINCAAMPDYLLESEVFGHTRGAFTGAYGDHPGLCETADGGTLLLDEISSMPLRLQAKLLRFMQDGRARRVGGNTEKHVTVRILAASNVDLAGAVKAKEFREDLFYRLDVLSVRLPALRERPGDVELLAAHFAVAKAKARGRPAPALGAGVLDALKAYPWPGNVRELEHVIERAVVLCGAGEIGLEHLSEALAGRASVAGLATSGAQHPTGSDGIEPLRVVQKAYARRAVEICGGVSQAARRLKISAPYLRRLAA